MYRINELRIKSIWKSQSELQKVFTENTNMQWSICPFTIILGAINSTNAGYKPPTSIPSDYTSFSKIFTGREAIQAVWDNGYYPIQDESNPDLAFKQIKPEGGDIFYGNIISDQVGIAYTASAQNNAFIQEQAVKNVVINVPNQDKNFPFINNLLTNIYKLFVLPEVNSTINSDNTFQIDRQWYILETATKTYNNETKELIYIQCTFVSLNDRLATTGLAINQYVQLGSPGDPVAYPTLDENKKVILDVKYLTPLPVTHCQISFYGSVMPISIALWGRDIDNTQEAKNTLKYRQYPTKLLFPWQYQYSTYDPISFQALPETNYFLTINTSSAAANYIEWQNIIKNNYDDNATRHYEGELVSKLTDTQNTNKVDDSGRYINYWDNSFLNSVKITDYNYATAGNPYFQYYNKDNKKFIGNTHYNMNNNKFKQLNTINAMHYFIYNPITEIPLTIRETIKINLNSIPIFGSFMNFFVGGLDIGTKLVSNLLIPQFSYINGLISSELYNYYTKLLFGTESPPDPIPIPLDVFRNDTTDSLQAILGTASHMTSLTFNLTDMINLQNFNINDGSISSQGVYNTVNLGQLNTAGKDTISLLSHDESAIPLLNAPDFNNKDIIKWAIDMIDIKVLGKSDFKITFYSMPDNRDGAVDDNYAIWSGTYQTIAKASNNTRLISNTFLLANNIFRFDKPFNFPKAIQPPPLIPRANPIFIDLSDQTQYGIKNSINWSDGKMNDSYEMRPNVNENLRDFASLINIDLTTYGYDSYDKFKEDYISMTFNFSLTVNATFSNFGNGPFTNSKNWFTPVKINLDELKTINNKNSQFLVNNVTYVNNSGDHEDNNRNWIFNINNQTGGIPNQNASLTPNSDIANMYINNLLWTNDNPTSSHTLPSSVWFKISAYTDGINNSKLLIRYQFISTLSDDFNYLSKSSANWNFTSQSLIINPKGALQKKELKINNLLNDIDNELNKIKNVSRETFKKGGD